MGVISPAFIISVMLSPFVSSSRFDMFAFLSFADQAELNTKISS